MTQWVEAPSTGWPDWAVASTPRDLKKRKSLFGHFASWMARNVPHLWSGQPDPGYTPEILLEGAADTAEILSCMVNGSEAEYEWKENKICLKAESLSEGYNRITVKVRGADGIVRTMKPWEVNVKPKTSTLVSQRTSQKPKGTRLWQSLRRLWNLIRAIAEIQNQTTRYLRALCRK